MAVDFGFVATFAIHVGIDEAVGQAQRQVVVEFAVSPHSDAAAVRVVARNPVTLALSGIAVKRLDPDTCIFEALARGSAAYRTGAAAGYVADQALAGSSGASGPAVDLRR